MKDHHGLEISTGSPDIIDLAEKFKTDLLSMGKGVVDVLPQADNELTYHLYAIEQATNL